MNPLVRWVKLHEWIARRSRPTQNVLLFIVGVLFVTAAMIFSFVKFINGALKDTGQRASG